MEPTTRERLAALLAAEPWLTMAETARRLGVSRERVRQLAVAQNLTFRRAPTPAPPNRGRGRVEPQPRLITGGVPVRLSATTVGTVGELLAAADLMARGFSVFFPLLRTTYCDLVTVDRDGSVERIEVRCGHRSGARVVYGKPDTSKSDRRAVVITGEPVHYDPPFSTG